MTELTTIRDCIEAIESDARALASYPGYAEGHEVLERIGRNALAALALLDKGVWRRDASWIEDEE